MVGESKEKMENEDTKLTIIAFLALKERVHRFYELRWYRGKLSSL